MPGGSGLCLSTSDAVLGRWKCFQSRDGDGLSTPIASTVRLVVQPAQGTANLKELLAPRLVESAEHLVVFKLYGTLLRIFFERMRQVCLDLPNLWEKLLETSRQLLPRAGTFHTNLLAYS